MINFYNYGYDLDGYDKYNEQLTLWDKSNYNCNFHIIKHIILKSPIDSYWYARDILTRRWPEAEPIIMKSNYAYNYAENVIKGRWPEAEPYIMKSLEYAYVYAKYVIRGRWPEAEHYLIKNAHYAFLYARDIIKDRWPEAEPLMETNEPAWRIYVRLFKS